MASPNDKLDADAQRAKSRGFGGYLKDRVTGSNDFADEAKSKPAAAGVMGSANSRNKESMDAAGFKKGGAVKPRSVIPGKKSAW